MTLTGKVVKEITSDQIGFLKIGNNITSYAWDGRDEFGNKLGNGVYLYSITTSDKEFEINSKFLSKGIGKLVIMR